MSQYILFIRGGDETANRTKETEQDALQHFRQWSQQLHAENRLIEATKLDDTGIRLIKKSGKIQVDGPFTETKEIIGGYFIIKAETLAEATNIAQQCPVFNFDGMVEIREIQD